MRSVPYPAPGEILRHEFLEPMRLTPAGLAQGIDVPAQHIEQILSGERAVTADLGHRLASFFGTSDGFWTGLQADHDRATGP